MPVRRLPAKANLEHLRNESRELQRRIRAGKADAVAELQEHHPRRVPATPQFRLNDAQLVVARSYGFPSWARLRRFLDDVDRYGRMPGDVPLPTDPADRFLRLACLTYGGDDRHRHAEARQLLADHPEVGKAGIHAMAAAGEVEAAQALLARDPGAAQREGGPHRWPPLLYAAYSRAEPTGPGRSTLAVAELLLAAGADANAGYLWDGHYPFTALTGALGGGEDTPNQPPHHESQAFARLLLEAGADPNDTQAIYNRMFRPENDHLELLFAFGLGRSTPGPWADRLGPTATPIATALAMDLQWAAEHDFVDRVRLLLDHGVEPDWDSGHPVYGGHSPVELAERSGNEEVVALLVAAGARRRDLDPVARLAAACLRRDRAVAQALVAEDPGLVGRAQEERAPLHHAASLGRLPAIELMVELGFDVNALGRTTPLHEAAAAGDLPLVEALVAMGADPSLRDRGFDSTPLGWADHFGHDHVVAYLERITPRS